MGDYQAFIEPNPANKLKTKQIKETINWNPINETAINEFDCDGLASLCFPKLFIIGNADPTKKSRLEKVSETEGWQHLIKYATISYWRMVLSICHTFEVFAMSIRSPLTSSSFKSS